MGAATQKSLQIGEKLVLIGLCLQLFFFTIFVIVAATFHYRLERALPLGKYKSAPPSTVDVHALPWKRHLIALYASSGLILVRSAFRVAEYQQGNAGFLLRKEYFLYIFDAVLMLAVMLVFVWIHPSQITDAYQDRLEVEKHESETEMQSAANSQVMSAPPSKTD